DQLRIAYVRFNPAHLDKQIERARVLIDRESWKRLIDRTSLNIYWNAPQLKSFIDELVTEPPIMTIQSAREKVAHTVNNRADILCEGLVS
ncbi:methyltransferase, partial [Acinetobacter baumannii]|nr:methyltransferase [Acinetobacter baumannii]